MDALRLEVTDWQDQSRWRWRLCDARGAFLADHEVQLDPASREYRGFLDLRDWLDFYTPAHPPAAQLRELGAWIGDQVFGGAGGALGQALADAARPPAAPLRIEVPAPARSLLERPLDLARLGGPTGPTLGELGLALVWCPAGLPQGTAAKDPAADALRILACFSLPDPEGPLNLRRERHALRRLVDTLVKTRGRAVDLRIIQYGATRETLRDALEESPGWDLIHLAGHGGAGVLLLEHPDGRTDRVEGADLARLLKLARGRVKLLILDACDSGAATQSAARARLGLAPARAGADPAATGLPSLGEDLARALDCAALAMRYPLDDAFATDLATALYEKLLDRGQPLPAALRLALDAALGDGPAAGADRPPLSPYTPVLIGPRALGLRLVPPARPAGVTGLPRTGLAYFPPEPARFVGRVGPMSRAGAALAPESGLTGVVFDGMAGAGKTACALELAYRHEQGRFTGQVWYQGPEADREVRTALAVLMIEIERQLDAPDLGLAALVDQPERFTRFTLPRLGRLLEDQSLLLVLDNLEHLLTESGDWRDPLWGPTLATLLGHRGHSRTLLTTRRLPRELSAKSPSPLVGEGRGGGSSSPSPLVGEGRGGGALTHQVHRECIHALSLPESVLLAQELPHLGPLFADEPGRDLLLRTLRVVQGHPKLLELADGLAADPARLAAQVQAAEALATDRAAVLDTFFAATGRGESAQPESAFVDALHRWTLGAAATLDPVARLLLECLCRLEPKDRDRQVIDANWRDLLTRLGDQPPAAAAARALPGLGLDAGLAALAAAGLLEVERNELTAEQVAQVQTALAAAGLPEGLDPADALAQIQGSLAGYRIHPGVAEAVVGAAAAEVLAGVDRELGDYFIAMHRQGLKTERQGGGALVVEAGRRGAPYLVRGGRWKEASTLLELMTMRDRSPETLAFAIPLMRRIGEATAGTERGLMAAGVLARLLSDAGRATEAESEFRRIIAESVAQGRFRIASAAAGELLNLLRAGGHFEDALALTGEKAGYTRAAGLGPWSQLGDDARRLQCLAALGRSEEVLTEVESLRRRMAGLPESGEAEEAVDPWNVREMLLHTGLTAAVHTERWELALELNAEILKSTVERGATDLEVARTRFNDYAPLLRLGRHDACRALLQQCRAVFEREHHVGMLGLVYSALADLQDKAGDRDGAVGFERAALPFRYQAGDPQGCAISHHNLSNYLERQSADPALALAHRLAAAVLRIQMGSGWLPSTIRTLARADLPAQPPPFAAIAERLEQAPGVRLRDLLARLPPRYPDGDAALAAVWSLVAQAREGAAADPIAVFAPLLEAIAAVAAGD